MSKPVAAAIVVTLASLVASLWWLQRPQSPAVEHAAHRTSHHTPTAMLRTSVAPVTRSTRPAVVAESSWDPQLIQHVQRKYRYLWADLLRPPAQLEQLRELLLQYEQLRSVARSPGTEDPQLDALERERIQGALATLDARIRVVLDPAQYARFESLRDSDTEQEHLSQYGGGISNLAPLNAAQERAILEARLRHKRRYEAGLRDFGLDRERLSIEERNYAHSNVAQTLNEYRDNFLAEVRPTLTEEQYFLLSSYETTEFTRELARLQRLINSK